MPTNGLVNFQRGYDTRVGEDGGGSKSPETEEQRAFVHRCRQHVTQHSFHSFFFPPAYFPGSSFVVVRKAIRVPFQS
jgi:hypothetical protein